MKDHDKILVCSGYDSILDYCPRIPVDNGETRLISTRKLVNNNKFKAEHDNLLYSVAVKASSKRGTGATINDFIVYINEPDFNVRRYYPLDINFNGQVSIEQSLIVGEEEQQVIVDSKKKVNMFRGLTRIPLIPIVHVSKVQIADNLYYFNEQVIFLSEQQFDQLDFYVKNCISIETGLPINYIVDDQRFRIKLWDVLNKRMDNKYFTVPAGYYKSTSEFAKEFNRYHDYSLNNDEWVGKHFIYYDNRGYFPATTRTMPLAKQIKKMY